MNIKISHSVLSLAFILSVLIKEGLSLECFQCNTEGPHGDACKNADKISDIFKACDPEYTFCRKIEQHIMMGDDKQVRIHRECAKEMSTSDGCLERTGTNKFKSWYCECKDAGCNSATSTTLSLAVLFAAAAAFFRIHL